MCKIFYAQLEEELLKINANQNGHYTGTIREYNDMVNSAYQSIIRIYDITNAPAYNNLTPAQFQEVQNYIADPNYQVDTRCWE